MRKETLSLVILLNVKNFNIMNKWKDNFEDINIKINLEEN